MKRHWKVHRELCMRMFIASDLGGNEIDIEVFAKDTADDVCKRIPALLDVCDTEVTELVKGEDVLEHNVDMSAVYTIRDTAHFFYKISVTSSGPPSLIDSSSDDSLVHHLQDTVKVVKKTESGVRCCITRRSMMGNPS